MTGKTLVVHSGTYKTGSSAIQVYLARADHFRAMPGARYPRTGRGLGVQHVNLNAELRQGSAFTPRLGSWDDLIREALDADAHTTIVSTENFSTLTVDQMRVIGDKCRAAGIKVRWIHYLREQASFYNAFYVERIVNMRPEFAHLIDLPFEDFGTWSPIDLGMLDYGAFADAVLEAIPEVDLVLRPFARRHLADGDAVADFCAAAGIPYVAEHAGSTNVGTGWQTVETARRLTRLVARADLGKKVSRLENPAAARMRWVALIRSELAAVTTEIGWNDSTAVYLTPAFRGVLQERYREANARVAAHADFDWPAIIADEPAKEFNVGTFAEIPADQLMEVVDRVMSVTLNKPQEILDLPKRQEPKASPARRAARFAKRKLG